MRPSPAHRQGEGMLQGKLPEKWPDKGKKWLFAR